jgi:hypothetical protein
VITRWFWINYLAALLITLPLPMLHIKVNGELARRVPIWECYLDLIRGTIAKWGVLVIGLHLGVTLAVCFVTWWLVLRPRKPHPEAVPAQSAEPRCDTGTSEGEESGPARG